MTKPIDWQEEERHNLLLRIAFEAAKAGPSKSAWGVFVASLHRAAEDFRHAGDTQQSRLAVIGEMANFLTVFLSNEPSFKDADGALRGNLIHLIAAVMDTQRGLHPDLFAPEAHKLAHNRPPPSNRAHQTSGAAARALEELQQAKVPSEQAAKMVVKAVQDGKCALPSRGDHRPFSATTVIGWRQRIKARIEKGKEDISQQAVDRFNAPMPADVGPTPMERADFILKTLRDGVGFR